MSSKKYPDRDGNLTLSRPRSTMPMRVLAEGEPRTRTKQEFATEVNINYIRSRMAKGIMPPGYNPSTGMVFRDLTEDLSFMEAFDVVQRGKEAFNTLPIGLRRELDHDPRNLGNATREQFERYGLLKSKAPDDASASGSAAPGAPLPPGDKVPANKPSGANKGAPKPPATNSDEE